MAEKMITRTFSETVASYSVMKAGKWSKDAMVTLPGALTRGDVMNYILDPRVNYPNPVLRRYLLPRFVICRLAATKLPDS